MQLLRAVLFATSIIRTNQRARGEPCRLCLLYSHRQDACRPSVNDGMVKGANRLGVGFDLNKAGGYPNIAPPMSVIAAVSGMNDAGVSAKASVAWRETGAAAGRAIAAHHPKGSALVQLARFRGPRRQG